jgi:hypothetical protein
MLVVWFAFALRESGVIRPDFHEVQVLSRFNFNAGGNFTFEATSAIPQSILIAVFDRSEFSELQDIRKSHDNLCDLPNLTLTYLAFLNVSNHTSKSVTAISDRTIVTPAFSVCRSNDSSAISYEALYRNPDSFLSADVHPCLYEKPAMCASYTILLVVWIALSLCKHPERGRVWYFMTLTILLLVADNFIFFSLLYHSLSDDSPTPLTWVRYFSRATSLLLFYVTLIVAAISAAKDPNEKFVYPDFVAAFATGLFLAVPLTFIEEYNQPDSELWTRFLAAVWLFGGWLLSFSHVFKYMKRIIAKLDAMEGERSKNLQTGVGQQYMTVACHLVLYSMLLFTSLTWLLVPYPEMAYFWASQTVLDVPYLVELVFGIVVFWKRNPRLLEVINMGVGGVEELEVPLFADGAKPPEAF